MASLPGVLDQALKEGRGWLVVQQDNVEAFAVRFPANRLALLYCHGSFLRRGHATILMDHIEQGARESGQFSLCTEASSFSYPLLLHRGWTLIAPEEIEICTVRFTRYRMIKALE